jgi:hypothetical protein
MFALFYLLCFILFLPHGSYSAEIASCFSSSLSLTQQYKQGVKKADDKTLWEAQELIAARCHPDDGEIITPLLCFAAYVPMQVSQKKCIHTKYKYSIWKE